MYSDRQRAIPLLKRLQCRVVRTPLLLRSNATHKLGRRAPLRNSRADRVAPRRDVHAPLAWRKERVWLLRLLRDPRPCAPGVVGTNPLHRGTGALPAGLPEVVAAPGNDGVFFDFQTLPIGARQLAFAGASDGDGVARGVGNAEFPNRGGGSVGLEGLRETRFDYGARQV